MINSDEIVKKEYERFKDSNLTVLANTDKVLVVELNPQTSGFGKCTFSFIGRFITCTGDIQSYTLDCTWDTNKAILNGSTPRGADYLLGKMAHYHKLQEFDEDLLNEKLQEIKETEIKNLDEDEKNDFLSKWEEYDYLLHDIDNYHLSGVDDFFNKIGIDDAWEYYSSFYKLPYHCYIFIAMILVINDNLTKQILDISPEGVIHY